MGGGDGGWRMEEWMDGWRNMRLDEPSFFWCLYLKQLPKSTLLVLSFLALFELISTIRLSKINMH